MQKRVDRNKNIYIANEKQIIEMAKKQDNSDFDETLKTLESLSPDLFGKEKKTPQDKKVVNKPHCWKPYVITGVLFVLILVIIIVLAVINNGNN